MSYPSSSLRRAALLSIAILLMAVHGKAARPGQIFFYSTPVVPHNSRSYALYNRDTVQEHPASGYVRRAANGDLIITVPSTAFGQYKIRFFDERNALLFEIRQIKDPLLIVERYNFEHAGQFQYELYRDAILVEKNRFTIRRE
jgi:hypothetical protein